MAKTKDRFDAVITKTLNVEKELSIAGTPVTATADQLNAAGVTNANAIVGVAAGYKIARSAAPVALDGSNPTPVAHGLTTCLAAFVQLVGTAAPGVGTSVLTCAISGASINVYAWKVTGAGDTTLIASTGTETFNWIAIGT